MQRRKLHNILKIQRSWKRGALPVWRTNRPMGIDIVIRCKNSAFINSISLVRHPTPPKDARPLSVLWGREKAQFYLPFSFRSSLTLYVKYSQAKAAPCLTGFNGSCNYQSVFVSSYKAMFVFLCFHLPSWAHQYSPGCCYELMVK